jgi:hypothetical protein
MPCGGSLTKWPHPWSDAPLAWGAYIGEDA